MEVALVTSIGIRSAIGAFLGLIGARVAWHFLDELLGIEATARATAQEVA